MRPLTAYNEFAKFFNCQVYAPDRLYWKQDLTLDDGVRLRLHGLTSTILSGRDGGDDTAPNLYLSPLQTVLNPEDDVVNLVIAHHPPDWCMDGDAIDDAVNGRAAIHLFGHKHRQRVTRDEHWVRIGAAAVNPDRRENAFDPGYNLIDVRVVGKGAGRILEITAHLRHWQDQPEGYTPRLDRNRAPLFRRSISIPTFLVAPVLPLASEEPAVVAGVGGRAVDVEVVDTEAAMSDERTRNLFYRFWMLRSSERREIADHFGLIEEGERRLPEPQRYGRALLRAGARGLIDALAKEVEKREGK